MADEYSTPLDMLMPPSDPDNCQPYPSMTPQQTNGACRGQEVMDRTYEVPRPGQFNFATDARPNPPLQQPAAQELPGEMTNESFSLPSIFAGLQSIQKTEYLLLAFVFYMTMNPDVVSMVVNNAPTMFTADKTKQSMLISVVATLFFYVAREYLYMYQ
tara:strand:- start:3786 stop:4259 length:474 start_codon:yes stop_codon:yes gene_type:complete